MNTCCQRYYRVTPATPCRLLKLLLIITFILAVLSNPIVAAETPEDIQEIILLHTNDLHFDFNYLDAVKNKITRFRTQYEHVFLLDAGDFSNRSSRWRDGMGPSEYADQLNAMIEIMNDLGYNAVTLGNHELGYHETVTRDIMRLAQFPFLGANVQVTTDNYDAPEPYTILKTSQGTSLALIGLCGGGYDRAEGITLRDAAETLAAHMHLRQENDVLVLLTHIGHSADRNLAEQYDSIDVIVGGHSHTHVDPPELWNGVLIAQTGGHSHEVGPTRRQYLGVVNLQLQGDTLIEKKGEVLEFNASGFTPSQFLQN